MMLIVCICISETVVEATSEGPIVYQQNRVVIRGRGIGVALRCATKGESILMGVLCAAFAGWWSEWSERATTISRAKVNTLQSCHGNWNIKSSSSTMHAPGISFDMTLGFRSS